MGKASPRGKGSSKNGQMNEEAASRIQSHADKTGTNQDFKSRAQAAAAKNSQKK